MYLRAQNQLLADIEALLRDSANARWTDAEIYRALNRAVQEWSSRVSIPLVYVLTDGWDSSTYEYTLPAYIRQPIQPQVRFDTQPDYGGGNTWADLRSFTVEPSTTGDLVLRIRIFPYDPTLTSEGRIIWYASNSHFPLTVPTLSSGIDTDDTSCVLDAALDIADTGWVKIEAEWICYAGVTRGATTTTLLNLQRAQEDTTAASHNSSTSVYFGVCSPNMALWQLLTNQTMAFLHEMFLTNAAPTERDMHERMMMYYDGKVAQGWRRFTPRAAKMVTTLEHL